MSRTHLCGYDLNLTYPQRGGHFPTLNLTLPTDGASASRLSRLNPTHDSETRERYMRVWKKAVERTFDWYDDDVEALFG